MSITQFLALAFISFVTACSLALLESEALQDQAWDLATETHNLAGPAGLKSEATDDSGADSKPPVAAAPDRELSDSRREPAIADQVRVLTAQTASDDPTAMALQREVDDLKALLAPLVVQERLLTRELGEEDVEVELTREEISILQTELAGAQSRLADRKQARELEQRAHLRQAAAHLREAGLTALADALDQQRQTWAADQHSNPPQAPITAIDALREEISRLRNDNPPMKQR